MMPSARAATTASSTPVRLAGARPAAGSGPGLEMRAMPTMVTTMPSSGSAPGRSPWPMPHSTGTRAAAAKIGAATLILVSAKAR